MKKLIALLSLTMAMTAFGAPQGDVEKTSDMRITATVITPLRVEAEAMKFNKVIKGANATAQAKFTITGEQGENIIVTIPNTATLTNTQDDTKTLNVTIAGGTDGQPTIMNLDDSKIELSMDGTIRTGEGTATGVYEGFLTAKVQYQ